MNVGFEPVHTVTFYYDGPRRGVADFRSVPHVYLTLKFVSEDREADDDLFELTPISTSTFALALEDWAIWRRREDARYAGHADESMHPALPADRARYEDLAALLSEQLRIDPARRILARGSFRVRQPVPTTPRGVLHPLEVCWQPVNDNVAAS